jgi:hypothetical protein
MRGLFVMLSCLFCVTVFAQRPKLIVGLNAVAIWNSYSMSQNSEPFLPADKLNWAAGVASKYSISKKLSNNLYGSVEWKANTYLQRAESYIHNPFQQATVFSVMKRIGPPRNKN